MSCMWVYVKRGRGTMPEGTLGGESEDKEFTRCRGCHQERTCVVENGVALCVKEPKGGCNTRRGLILADLRKRGMKEERRAKR